MAKELSLQKQKFVEEYYDRCNGEAAAIAAGYSRQSARSQASQLLKEPLVAAYLEELREAAKNRVAASRERLIEELEAIAFANMDDYVSYKEGEAYEEPEEEDQDPSAKPMKAIEGDMKIKYIASDALTRSQKAVIQEISDHPKSGFKMKLYSKTEAIKMLNQMQGYEAPKKIQTEISGSLTTKVEATSFSIKAREE